MFWKGSLRVVIKTCNYKGILDIIKTIPDDDWKKDTENRYRTWVIVSELYVTGNNKR